MIIFGGVFLFIDGVAAFSGAYNLLGGIGWGARCRITLRNLCISGGISRWGGVLIYPCLRNVRISGWFFSHFWVDDFKIWQTNRRRFVNRILIRILLGLVVAMTVYPLVWMLLSSFKTNREIYQPDILLPESRSFAYRCSFSGEFIDFYEVLTRSILLAGGQALLATFVTAGLALYWPSGCKSVPPSFGPLY